LNYFDAHEPYIPPVEYSSAFGIRPQTSGDYQFLIDFIGMVKERAADHDLLMTRDCYDDCIAALDADLERLLRVLERQGLLNNTEVIITSDHGEAFGLHGIMGHSYSVCLEETGVPLVILSPRAPAGRIVDHPVTLRDLPATVVDLLGISATSPFQGHSLASYWNAHSGDTPENLTTPAFSERVSEVAFQQPGTGREHAGVEMSVVAQGFHYVRSGEGTERLFDLRVDPYEQLDVSSIPIGQAKLTDFRNMLLNVLSCQPGSAAVEKAYLAGYRSWLQELVRGQVSDSLAVGPRSSSVGR
jgi:arylsulfatase A-like enzyme